MGICYRKFGRKIRAPKNTPFKSCWACEWDVCIPCYEKSIAGEKAKVQTPARTHTSPTHNVTQRPTHNIRPMSQAPQLPKRAPIPTVSEPVDERVFILGLLLVILLVCGIFVCGL